MSSFPPAHKKWLYGAVVLFVLLWGGVALWVKINAPEFAKNHALHGTAITVVIKESADKTVPQVTAALVPAGERDGAGNTVPPQPKKPAISIIMTGLGISEKSTARAVSELPSQVTLGFSPYAPNLTEWLKKSEEMKHENLVLLPMESAAYPKDDAGDKSLSSRLSDAENAANLDWVLKKAKGTLGVMNFMGSRFLTNAKKLEPVFTALHENNFMFIESPMTEFSQAQAVAVKSNAAYLKVALEIDTVALESDIRQQLAALEKQALEKGYAVGIASPYPVTFAVLKTWSDGLDKHGIILAPLSTGRISIQ